MKALLINPKDSDNFVTEIEVTDWRDIAPKLGCDLFTCVTTPSLGENTLFVDDEGMLNNALRTRGGFALRDYAQLLHGRGLVLGHNNKGESVDVTMTKQEAEYLFGILTPVGPIFKARI